MDNFKNKPVYNLSKTLDTDKEVRKDYIEGNVSNTSDSDSEDDTTNIVIKKKVKKNKESSFDLLERLIQQQDAFLKVQKKVYKLESEITIEETKSRYIKLDLNNTFLKYEEENKKCKKLGKFLLYARIEIWTCRILFLLYIIYQVFFFFSFLPLLLFFILFIIVSVSESVSESVSVFYNYPNKII
jgi:hypothetical protein